MKVSIEDHSYIFEFDKHDPFVSPAYAVAFCDELAKRYKPRILDPLGYACNPVYPEFMAYRLVHDDRNRRVCLIYEV